MALHDVFHQRDQAVNLPLGIGQPDGPIGRITPSQIDYLNANRTGIQPGVVLPRAQSRVVGPSIFVHQSVDLEIFTIIDQVVRTDLLLRQDLQRGRRVKKRVMQNEIAHPTILADCGITGINARTRRASAQQGRKKRQQE